MGLKQAIIAALERGADYRELLDLIQSQELDPRKAYDTLEQVWRELGFDEAEQGRGKDELEHVMEKLWYACPKEPDRV